VHASSLLRLCVCLHTSALYPCNGILKQRHPTQLCMLLCPVLLSACFSCRRHLSLPAGHPPRAPCVCWWAASHCWRAVCEHLLQPRPGCCGRKHGRTRCVVCVQSCSQPQQQQEKSSAPTAQKIVAVAWCITPAGAAGGALMASNACFWQGAQITICLHKSMQSLHAASELQGQR
jgi:hypothetical protein